MSPRKPLGTTKRKAIHERDKGICIRCKSYVAFNDAEIEHAIPVRYGGSDDDCNLNVVCHRCHVRKTTIETHKENIYKYINGNKSVIRHVESAAHDCKEIADNYCKNAQPAYGFWMAKYYQAMAAIEACSKKEPIKIKYKPMKKREYQSAPRPVRLYPVVEEAMKEYLPDINFNYFINICLAEYMGLDIDLEPYRRK